MRTHWLCRLFGHNYKSRAIKVLADSGWTFKPVCTRCGDSPTNYYSVF